MIPVWFIGIILFVAAVLVSWFFHLISQNQTISALWACFASIVLVLLAVTLYIRNDIIKKQIKAKTPIYSGEITPGNEPTPFPDGIPEYANAIYLVPVADRAILLYP